MFINHKIYLLRSELREVDVSGLQIPYLSLACLELEDELPGLRFIGLATDVPTLDSEEVFAIHRRLMPSSSDVEESHSNASRR